MLDKILVTIIVCTYNSNFENLIKTLTSLINQEQIKIEIIIADDASKIDNFLEIKNFFKENDFKQYKIAKCQNNVGTVKNILNALEYAEGEYIYLISPGDYLYDTKVIYDFYNFSLQNKLQVCFGNAIWYSNDLIIKKRAPKHPEYFSEKYNYDFCVLMFFVDNHILGPCYFRSKAFLEKYLKKIDNISKYVEDNTTTEWALLDGEKVKYFDRNMIYYEYGSGISTNNNTKWKNIINNDFEECRLKMKEFFPNNKILDFIFCKSKLKKIIKHPILECMVVQHILNTKLRKL